MKFSILIAHFNNYHYFVDCYKSIINQTYQNFEVIIVDDCSTDDSLVKIKELVKNDNRFKIYQNEVNKGVGYTKRKLVELASGEICGFVDPDDALTPDAIEKSIEPYHHDKNIVATYSKFYICDESLEKKNIFKNTVKVSEKCPMFFNINLEIAHFFTFKRSAYFETEGININYKIAEDQDLYLKLYDIGRIEFINKPLLFYRIHSKGLSHQENKKRERDYYWHHVLKNTLKRRDIKVLYGKNISEIDDLATYIHHKQNNITRKILRKLWSLFS